MNVVFVNPPIRLPEAFAHYPTFSTLGMLANAARTREADFDTRVVDAFTLTPSLNLRPDGGRFWHVGAEVEELASATQAVVGALEGPTVVVVGITMFSDMNRLHENLVPATVEQIRARLPGTGLGLADLHICGMNYFPYDAERILERIPGADWLLVGEAERTLPGLLDRLAAGESLEDVPRLGVRDRDGIRFNNATPAPIEDLDALPTPAFDLLDMERFFSAQADAIRNDLVHEYHVVERQLPLMTSRGCPFRCSFCTNQVLALPWRAHSVDKLVELVVELRDRYQVDRFLFLDDNINVDQERFRALVTALAEERIPWDAVNGYRADRLDRDMVQAIKAAGNTKVTVSAESGDPNLLETVIRKGLKLSSVVKVAKLCDEERVPLQVHYIIGVPGETKTQINSTLEFATALFDQYGAWPLLQHAIPFPGTRLFDECEAAGYFVEPPFEIPGDRLEVDSIIETPEFSPGEVGRMKRNAQHLHAAMQSLVYLDVGAPQRAPGLMAQVEPPAEPPELDALKERLELALFRGGRELFIGGGEPTLRDDLAQIVAMARELGFGRVSLITDAHAFAEDAGLVSAGVDHLIVELHGPSAMVHDIVARCSGAFARAVAGIRAARAAGATFDVNIGLTRANVDAMASTVRLAHSLHATSVHLQYPGPETVAFGEGLVPSWAQVQLRLAGLLRRARRGTVTVQGVPLCLMREPRGALRPLPPWRLLRSLEHRMKHPTCRQCVGYVVCGGFYRPEVEAAYGMLDAAGLTSASDRQPTDDFVAPPV